ncbi:hypothetical protein N9L47_03340, partial [Rhodobacteraceae bacterium]|nr:hypothetical protein [Paracoccaceae bacterium]
MSIKPLIRPGHFLIASVVATLVLVFFMEGVARIVLGAPMKPAVLICNIFGWDESLLWLGEVIHFGLGIIAFPIGYVIALAVTGMRAGVVSGVIWGVILWIGAGTVFMSLAGAPLFWGFGKATMAALVAHVAYGAVLGGLLGRGTQSAIV